MTKISIITVCYNSSATIAGTLRSVSTQQYSKVEHIIVDGASKDNTVEIVQRLGKHVAHLVSEPDRGIYDAMNKGLALATGDFVGFLNSDDNYSDDAVLADVVQAFLTADTDYVYGDLLMMNGMGEIVRNWRTGDVPHEGLVRMQIPHPALFVRRTLLTGIDPAFDPSYRIAADLKQQLILINKMRAKGVYIRRPLVHMRLGGASTNSLFSYISGWIESARAYDEVFGSGGWVYTTRKVFSKIKMNHRKSIG